MSKAMSENKDAILQAALQLFKDNGFDNVSIKDICAAAGVPRSSFYVAFSNKSEILVYSLKSVREDFELSMPQFIQAENDLERIWLLTESFLRAAVDIGPDLCKVYFSLELSGACSLFDILESFNPWLISLLRNCQNTGIVRNRGDAEQMIPIQLNIAIATLFNWVRHGGNFSLKQKVREEIEFFLDVKPDFRSKISL